MLKLFMSSAQLLSNVGQHSAGQQNVIPMAFRWRTGLLGGCGETVKQAILN